MTVVICVGCKSSAVVVNFNIQTFTNKLSKKSILGVAAIKQRRHNNEVNQHSVDHAIDIQRVEQSVFAPQGYFTHRL